MQQSPQQQTLKHRTQRAGLSALCLLVSLLATVVAGCTPSPHEATSTATPEFRVVSTTAFKVYDGDTFHALVDGIDESVRLIGVDTPEMDAESAEELGAALTAKEYTESLIEGKQVWLVLDVGAERDRYDRLLAYVWLTEPPDTYEEMKRVVLEETLNGLLLVNGYAALMTIEPNTSFAKEFKSVLQ